MSENGEIEVEIDENHAKKVIDAILAVNKGRENYVTVFYALQAAMYLAENMAIPGKAAESLEQAGLMFFDAAAEVAAEEDEDRERQQRVTTIQ